MDAKPESIERRRLLSIARKYRRDGYRVTVPDRTAALPAFLGDHLPDLVAESEFDRVVVEVKHVTALPGANDLVDLARRVEREPGWRLELVTLGANSSKGVSPTSIQGLRNEIESLVQAKFFKAAFICTWVGIEDLLWSVARTNRINPANATYLKLVRDLVTHGLIANETRASLETAFSLRNRLAHDYDGVGITEIDVENLMDLWEGLLDETSAVQAA